MSFSLLTKEWIPVRTASRLQQVGLLHLFQNWDTFHDIGAANPPRQIALYRLLIAIVHAAIRGPNTPSEYRKLWSDPQFGEEICNYLHQWENRFDLLDDENPFLQDKSLTEKIKELPIGKALYQDANTPIIWFKPYETPWLSLADATQELLRMQSLELGGRKSDLVTAGAGRWTQGRHVFPLGASLRETLLFNLNQYETVADDRPAWEQSEPYGTGERKMYGYLDWLTCCERRIFLTVKNQQATYMRLASGWKVGIESNFYYDHHQTFRFSEKNKNWFPLSLDPNRQLWQDSEAILHTVEKSNYRPKIFDWLSVNRKLKKCQTTRILGFSHAGGTQSAKPKHWVDDILSIPQAVLEDTAMREWVNRAIEWAKEFGTVFTAKVLKYESKEQQLDQGDRNRIIEQLPSLKAALYSYIGQKFPILILNLSDLGTAQSVLENWVQDLRLYSEELIQLLVDVMPNYRSKVLVDRIFKIALYSLQE